MNNVKSLSYNDLDDFLWKNGLDIHNVSKTNRINYLKFISENIGTIDAKTIISALWYCMHSYFDIMSADEKKVCIDIVVSTYTCLESFEEIWNIICVLIKGCESYDIERLTCILLDYHPNTNSTPIEVLSFCRCCTYVYDNVVPQKQKEIFNHMCSILNNNKIPYIDESIIYLIKSIEGDGCNENCVDYT